MDDLKDLLQELSHTCKPPPRRAYRGFLREGTGDRLWWARIKPKPLSPFAGPTPPRGTGSFFPSTGGGGGEGRVVGLC